MKRSRRRNGQRGSGLLEASLCFLCTIVIFIGITDVGQVLFIQSTLTERVRSATSHGSRTYDPDVLRNIVLYGTATPAADQRPFFNLTPAMVSVERRDAGTAADRVIVGISGYPLVFLTPGLSRFAQAVPIKMVASYDGA